MARGILIFGFRPLVSMLELRTGVLLLDTGGFSVLTSNSLCVFQASEVRSPSCVAQVHSVLQLVTMWAVPVNALTVVSNCDRNHTWLLAVPHSVLAISEPHTEKC